MGNVCDCINPGGSWSAGKSGAAAAGYAPGGAAVAPGTAVQQPGVAPHAGVVPGRAAPASAPLSAAAGAPAPARSALRVATAQAQVAQAVVPTLVPAPATPVLPPSEHGALAALVAAQRGATATTVRFAAAEGSWMSVMGVWSITVPANSAADVFVDIVGDPRPSAAQQPRSMALRPGDVVTIAEVYRESSSDAAHGLTWRECTGWCRITKVERGGASTGKLVVIWAKESAAFRASESGCVTAFYEKADPPYSLPAVVLERVVHPRDDASQSPSAACSFKHLRSAGWDNRFFLLAHTADEDKYFRGCAALPKQFGLGKSLTTDTSKPATTPRTPGSSRQQGPRAWQFGYHEDSFLKIVYSDMLCQGNAIIESYQAWQAAKKSPSVSSFATKELQRKYERLKRTMPPPEKVRQVMDRIGPARGGDGGSLRDDEIVSAKRLQELMPEWDAKSCTRFIEYCISTGVDNDGDGNISGRELRAEAEVRSCSGRCACIARTKACATRHRVIQLLTDSPHPPTRLCSSPHTSLQRAHGEYHTPLVAGDGATISHSQPHKGFVLEIKTRESKMVFKLAQAERGGAAGEDSTSHLRAWSRMLNSIFRAHHAADSSSFVIDLSGAPM